MRTFGRHGRWTYPPVDEVDETMTRTVGQCSVEEGSDPAAN